MHETSTPTLTLEFAGRRKRRVLEYRALFVKRVQDGPGGRADG